MTDTNITTARAELKAARRERRLAADALARMRSAVSDRQAEVDAHTAEREDTETRIARNVAADIKAGGSGHVAAAVNAQHVMKLAHAETALAAAMKALPEFEAADSAAAARVEAAERGVKVAARQQAFTEVRAKFAAFRKQLTELTALRVELLAAYLSLHGTRDIRWPQQASALSDSEWAALDRPTTTCAELDIGLPVAAITDYELIARGERAVIARESKAFAEHLAALERGDVADDNAPARTIAA